MIVAVRLIKVDKRTRLTLTSDMFADDTSSQAQ